MLASSGPATLQKQPAVVLSVIALTFFALFSLPNPSFFLLHDLTTLSLFLYPDNHSFIPFFHLPFHTSQEQDETAHGLHLTIRYWYMRIGIAIVRENPRRFGQPTTTLLTRTRELRHLRTPTTDLAMGQDLRNPEDDPPPRPTEEPTSRESNRPPARNHSSDSR